MTAHSPIAAIRHSGRNFAALALGMILCCGMSLRADVTRRGEEAQKKNKNPIEVPEVRGVSAEFIAGGSVQVELVAAVGTLRTVDFVIRQQPQHGTLSEVRPHPTENNKAVVIYTHNSKDAPLSDGFTFSCRLGTGPFSAPGRAYLNGKKFDPILKVRSQPKFERIFAGGMYASTMVVENVGAAPYVKELQWQAPFTGPQQIVLAPGQKEEFIVSFRPEKAGNYRWELPLQDASPESVLYFYGDSIPALTVSPGQLSLIWNEEAGVRTASLTLGNGRPDDMTVKLSGSKRLQMEQEVKIEAQGKQIIQIALAESDVAAFTGEILVESSGVKEKVFVTAAAQPARVVLVEPEGDEIAFGQLKQKTKAEHTFTIANKGGLESLTNLRLRPPFSVEESGQVIRLQPGQERRFLVKLDTRAAGRFTSPLEISGSGSPIELDLTALVTPLEDEGAGRPAMATSSSKPPASTQQVGEINPQPVANSSQDSARRPASSGRAVTHDPSGMLKNLQDGVKLDRNSAEGGVIAALMYASGVTLNHPGTNPNLDPIAGIYAPSRTSSSIQLAWDKTKVKPAGWRVEYASDGFDPKSGIMVKFWEPLKDITPQEDQESGKMTASIKSLRPAAQYEFRVLGVDQEGKLSRPSPVIMVSTLPEWRVPAWVWRTLLMTALGVVLFILYRMRRGDFELEY